MRITPRRYYPLVAATALSIGLAGCADEPLTTAAAAPEAPAALNQGSGESPLTPNGVPYRNPEYKHATGRSGGAQLTARALLGKDGVTDLEVTTGALDSDDAPHQMTKLQVKLMAPNDSLQEVLNYNGLRTGFATYEYEGRARHSDIQVQGNVTVPNASGKGSRTGVVTITERVNLRPDLVAQSITGPAQAYVETNVDFIASVAETNGDVGAWSSCVWYIDGTEISRADQVWVAEGDVINCAFTHNFAAVGTYDIELRVESVVPGDWDTANNSVSHTIEIVEPIIEMHGWASASESHDRYRYESTGSYYSSSWDSYYHNQWSYVTDRDYDRTTAYLYAYAPETLSFPVNSSVVQSSGGQVQDQAVGTQLGNLGDWCVTQLTGKSNINICSYPGGGTTVNVTRNSGAATYYSHNYWSYYDCYYSWWYGWYCYSGSGGSYYNTSSTWGGGFQALASDYTFDIDIHDSARTFTADATIPLSSYNYSWGTPRYCYGSGYYYGSYCYENSGSSFGKSGWTAF